MPALDITREVQSLTTFRRRSADIIRKLKKSRRPVLLTVKGRVTAIVQDAEAYQHLLDLAARADAKEGIRQGIEDARKGRVRPAEEFFTDGPHYPTPGCCSFEMNGNIPRRFGSFAAVSGRHGQSPPGQRWRPRT